MASASKAAAAYAARPRLYKIPAYLFPEYSSPIFPSSCPPTKPHAHEIYSTPAQVVGLIPNLVPSNGNRARANSNSYVQTNFKKNCAPYSSSTSVALHSTLSTSFQSTPPSLSQSSTSSHFCPCSLCIMKTSSIACSTSLKLRLNN